MCISHPFSSIYNFDGHLLFVSIEPLRSFFYLLPSFNKQFKTIRRYHKLSPSSGMYGICCQKFTSNPSFRKAWQKACLCPLGLRHPGNDFSFSSYLTLADWWEEPCIVNVTWFCEYTLFMQSQTQRDAFSKEQLLLLLLLRENRSLCQILRLKVTNLRPP